MVIIYIWYIYLLDIDLFCFCKHLYLSISCFPVSFCCFCQSDLLKLMNCQLQLHKRVWYLIQIFLNVTMRWITSVAVVVSVCIEVLLSPISRINACCLELQFLHSLLLLQPIALFSFSKQLQHVYSFIWFVAINWIYFSSFFMNL